MTDEEAYRILGINAGATEDEVKNAYNDLAKLLHPDLHQNKSERVRNKAEEEFIKVNLAYEALKGAKMRDSVPPDSVPPKLRIVPDHIIYRDIIPNQSKYEIFQINNIGGNYNDLTLGLLPSWLIVTDMDSLNQSQLPMILTIQATGQEWGQKYECYLPIGLEGNNATDEIKVKIEMQMDPEPAGHFTSPQSSPSPTTNYVKSLAKYFTQNIRRAVIALIGLSVLTLIAFCSVWVPTIVNSYLIVGKWQHGISKDIAPQSNIDQRLLDKLRGLPENKLYYLEFSNNGKVVLTEDSISKSGIYTISWIDNLDIKWGTSNETAKLKFSEDGNKLDLHRDGYAVDTMGRLR